MKFYFTFGCGHTDKSLRSLFKNYCIIDAPTEDEAREVMHKARGIKWSMCYNEDEFKGQPERYGLTEVSLEEACLE